MKRISDSTPQKRPSIVTIEVLLTILVTFASAMTVVLPECLERTLHIVCDAVFVALVLAVVEFVIKLETPTPMPAGVAFTLARQLVWHHLRLGIAGGYLFSLVVNVFYCLAK